MIEKNFAFYFSWKTTMKVLKKNLYITYFEFTHNKSKSALMLMRMFFWMAFLNVKLMS